MHGLMPVSPREATSNQIARDDRHLAAAAQENTMTRREREPAEMVARPASDSSVPCAGPIRTSAIRRR